MKAIFAAVFVFVAATTSLQQNPPAAAKEQSGVSVCVAPNSGESPQRCADGLCGSGELSLKIDNRPISQWPKTVSMEIRDLDATARHRVVVYRAGKPQQSFRFRFSEFKSNRLCLFLNDLYWTAQLWESKRAPWCKCGRSQ